MGRLHGAIAWPLTELLNKDHFHWSVMRLKMLSISSKYTMTLPFWLPDFSKSLAVETNTSSTRMREVLLIRKTSFLFHPTAVSKSPIKICLWKTVYGNCDVSAKTGTLSSWSAFYHKNRSEELEILCWLKGYWGGSIWMNFQISRFWLWSTVQTGNFK